MTRLLSLYDAIATQLEAAAPWLIPTLARLVFAGVLLVYYLNSGLAKFGEGILGLFRPDAGAYVTIFPKAMEAVSYDVSQLSIFHWAVTLAGTWAEVILPIAIVIGLFTRLASLAMIGFVFVQSVVDVYGHGVTGDDIGAWFDAPSNALLLDQRAFWVFALGVLVLRGAGPISVDRALMAYRGPSAAPA